MIEVKPNPVSIRSIVTMDEEWLKRYHVPSTNPKFSVWINNTLTTYFKKYPTSSQAHCARLSAINVTRNYSFVQSSKAFLNISGTVRRNNQSTASLSLIESELCTFLRVSIGVQNILRQAMQNCNLDKFDKKTMKCRASVTFSALYLSKAKLKLSDKRTLSNVRLLLDAYVKVNPANNQTYFSKIKKIEGI
ncbi:hypothetical protein AHF37_07565 [Paragonimus kellicotti]|nr:hypothetical protein AHF37_07565 [Paragonimus kellicotti]